ncbi:MAG: PLP-dependent aminotransferase family protein [Thermoleophilia bacterium]|nr:PLP-dependent aminotransferase family protein [Thermoleophilia bacterium]
MADTISFARGVPAPELLPVEELADCARTALRDPAALGYAPGGGFPPLRAWIAERHGVEPERVVVTNGSLQGFVLLARRLVAGRRRVVVEAPTYDRPLAILAELGADVVPLRLDDDGLDPEALAAVLREGPPPAFLYTIPTFQNPSGRTLPAARRERLVEVAREHGLLVLEDDPYGLVRFDGEPEPLLLELDGGEHVVYSSSFSKTAAPGLRVGYLVLPRTLAADVERAAVSTYLSPAVAGQATLYEFLRRGLFGPHLRRLRALLRVRRDAMLDALASAFAPEQFTPPRGGYFVWLRLPGGVDEGRFVADARGAGVALVAGADFYPAAAGSAPAVRLAYSAVSPEEIARGVARLAGLVPPLAALESRLATR